MTIAAARTSSAAGMAFKLSLFLFVISGGKRCRTTSGDGDVYLYCTGSVIVPTTASIEEIIWLQALSCEVGVFQTKMCPGSPQCSHGYRDLHTSCPFRPKSVKREL